MVNYDKLLHGYKLANKDDYVFVKTGIKGVHIAYSHDGYVHTSLIIRRNLHNYNKIYFFVSSEPMYKIEANNTLDNAPLMDDDELMTCLNEIDFDFDFDEE